MNEALDIYKSASDSIIFATQLAMGIITGFLALFGIFISILAYINFNAASAPRKELERLKLDIGKLSGELASSKKELEELGRDLAAVKKELEELKKFARSFEGKALMGL